ncbi:MAG: citrate synthase [Nitrospira sp.]|nr:citrate synthase [bacterium]MBL7048595.1 citrate synthase [Nitrospira sp.]
MENLLEKIIRLELEHDGLDMEIVKKKNVKLGLRNLNGKGVVAGITSKGQVLGYGKNEKGQDVAIPGQLIYCGYNVKDIVENVEQDNRFGFEETAYMLLTGELPTVEDLEGFSAELSSRRALPETAKKILQFTSKNDDQMGALHGVVSSLHRFDKNPKSTDISDVTSQCVDLIAKFPTIIAYNYNVNCVGEDEEPMLLEPDPALSTAENFLYMLNGKIPDKEAAAIFDIALILHAEHGGGNNSTFSVRTVSSTQTDTYMAICAGIASLSGYLHGGASEAVIDMMDDMKAKLKDWTDDKEISAYLTDVLDKKQHDGSGKIYGMGHAVYTVSDPREPILKKKAYMLAERAGRLDEYHLYDKVSKLAVGIINKKKGKKVCPNVDFYSGFVYSMLGIPKELYTPIFAMARVTGWAAHRIEEILQGRLMRPSYISSLSGSSSYVPLQNR